jgi:PAS domain S-box-containing protein
MGASFDRENVLRLVSAIQTLASARSEADVVERVRASARGLVGADGMTFVLRDGDHVNYVEEDAVGPLWKGGRFPATSCISGWVIGHNEQVAIPDIYADPRIPTELYADTFVRSMAMVPVNRESPIGAIGVYWARPHGPDGKELDLLQALADAASTAITNVALVRGQQRLVDRLNVFASVIEASPDFVGITDPSGVPIYVNPAGREMVGLARDHDVSATTIADYYTPDVDAARILEDMRERGAWSGETTFRHWETGAAVPVSDTHFEMRDPVTRRLLGYATITRDISTERRNALEREALLQQAEATARAKDEFLAMLGHELRNPLAPIVAAIEILRSRSANLSAVAGTPPRELAIIERQVTHLVRLVDDLLDVARITRGSIALERTHVEIASVVGKAVEIANPLVEERRHRLRVDVPSSGLGTMGDSVRLAQVVANLLTNAAKYTDPGGDIHVHASATGDEIILSVTDTGAGIPDDLLPVVFDVFVQGPRTKDRSQGGLGLGLTLVRRLVEAHGGRVSASSKGNGKGSTFEVRLPLAGSPPAPIDGSDVAKADDGARGIRVLVVDDNVDAAELLAECLAVDGFDVRVANDAPEALAIVETWEPYVAILDIGLPGMDGYELATRLRARLPSVPLMALSGYGQAADRRRSAAAGFDEHRVKPLPIDELTDVVRALAERAASGRRQRGRAQADASPDDGSKSTVSS